METTVMMSDSCLTPSQYECPTCQSTSENQRNLVIFIDGTTNKPGDQNTNVMKLYQKVVDERIGDSGLEQCKHYLKGIGAYDTDSRLTTLGRVGKALEVVFARNVEENVKNAYMWLVDRYRVGDRIYLFGFSRGAYQVRALASMVHEVGLVKKEEKEKTDEAYDKYLAIDPYNPDTRRKATQFKQNFCQHGVRIHFVGVWDTVSSLGFIKKDVHVTASASVTNACHFRHALALDECRVKFLPEYFLEMNVHRSVHSPRQPVCDVKEVWFAGSHSDVGGTDRTSGHEISTYTEDDSGNHMVHTHAPGSYPFHAGNVSLSWMRQEAAANGLVFEPKSFVWDPQDIDVCIIDAVSFGWGILEVLPIRHQVSFSGPSGEHRRRWHLFHPRLIIPGQQVHTSISSSDLYAPRAILAGGIYIPATSGGTLGELWATEHPDKERTTHLLMSLLTNQSMALEHFERVIFLLQSEHSNEQIQLLLGPQWLQKDGKSDFDRFALTVIYDMASNFTAPDAVVSSAAASLADIVSNHQDSKILYILRFLIRQSKFRQRFIGNDAVQALACTLDWAIKSPNEIPFLLITECLYHLINNNHLRDAVVDAIQSKLAMALESRSSNYLLALLKVITSIMQFPQDLSKALKPKILELAKRGRGLVGPAAVEALVALKIPLTHDIHFPNILGYFIGHLPLLDAETSNAPSADNLTRIPLVNGSGSLDEEIIRKLVLTIKSSGAHERTSATLAVLKLCSDPGIRNSCLQLKVTDIFLRQLSQKKTCLLAAYALTMCLEHDTWSSDNFTRAARSIIVMVDKCWFDDAIGQVEGSEIFRRLLAHPDLRRQVIDLGTVDKLAKKLEGSKHREVRMGVLCLDILGKTSPLDLEQIVANNVARLTHKNKKVQKRGVKVLAALAQTSAGEDAIKPRMSEIISMPLSSAPRSKKMFGPAAALYDLSKNEALRAMILKSHEFRDVKRHVQPSILHRLTT